MEFNLTKQALTKMEGKAQLSVEELLGIMEHDLYEDIQKAGSEKGYETLPINDEGEFISAIVSLTNRMARIYKNNKECFASEQNERRWNRANDKLSEFREKVDDLTKEIERLSKVNAEIKAKADEYGSLERKRSQLCDEENQLQDLLEELQSLTSQIYEVKKSIQNAEEESIPEAKRQLEFNNKQIEICRKQLDELIEKEEESVEQYETLTAQIQSQEATTSLRFEQQDELRKKLKDLKDQEAEAGDQITRFKEEIVQLSDIIADFKNGNTAHEEKKNKLRGEIEILKDEERAWRKKIDDLNIEIASQRSQNLDYERQKEMLEQTLEIEIQKKSQLESIRKEHQESESRILEIDNELRKISSDQSDIVSKRYELEQQYHELKDDIRQKRQQLALQKHQTKDTLKEYQLIVKRNKREQDWLTDKINALLDSQDVEKAYGIKNDFKAKQIVDGINQHQDALSRQIKEEELLINELLNYIENGR